MKNLIILGLILGFALPSYGQLVSVDTITISGDTLEVEKVLYGTDTIMSVRKSDEADYFSVKIEKGKVVSLFSSTEETKVFISYHFFESSIFEDESFYIIDSNDGWDSRTANKKEEKIIKKRIKQIEKEYLKYI